MKTREGLALTEVAEPVPRRDEIVVRVAAISLNRGEVRMAARAAEGTIPGWDIAGVVEAAAPGGSGPAAGQRVAAIVPRAAWAELVAVPVWQAAVIPDGVSFASAATLPVAGLTVLRAFAVAGSLIGRRVLITGASGGVGMLAVQLAKLGGARVTAVRDLIREAGEASGDYDLVLESAGGQSLAAAIANVARGGVVVTIGNSSETDTTFNARTLYAKGGASIYGLLIFDEVERRRIGSPDLAALLELVRSGQLAVNIEVERTWRELPLTLEDLEQRRFTGKAVVTL